MNKNELKPSIRFKGFTDAWEKQRLADIVTICTGKLDANAMVPGGKYDFYTSGIAKYKTNTFSFSGESITIAGNGATVGYLHLADGLFDAYQRTYVLQNFTLDRIFVYYSLLKYLPDKIKEEARASNIPYIVIDMLNNLVIKTGHKNEIRKIGNILLSLESLITFYKRKSEKLENLKKSLLEKMFVSDGEQFPAIRFKGFTNTWEKIKLGNIVQFYNGESYEAQQLPKGKYELINLNSISIDGGLKESGKFINNPKETLLKDDLVMVLSDVAHGDLLGRVALIPLDYRYVLNQRVALLRVVSTVIPSFLFWNINANQKYFKKSGAGSSQLNISKFNVLDFDICFPSKQEQIIIDSFLKKISSIITFYKRKCDKLENIKKSLLEKMFC
ncbi:restriction endonuclease subunit S [Mycoplasma sp. Z1473D]